MNSPKFDFAVGGQAVIEGVMMRSKNYIAVAVRDPNEKIVIKDFPFQSLIQKHKWLNIPIVRGVLGMFEMMIVGIKALNFSADIFAGNDTAGDLPYNNRSYAKKFLDGLIAFLNVCFSLGFALFLFKFVPLLLTEIINRYFPSLADNYILYNLVDAFLKFSIFIIYIVGIAMSKTIYRVFEYHGAEHKAVFNYEEGSELTIENSQKQSRIHPRCGTSFVIFVFLISVIMYTFIPRDPNFAMHLLKRLSVLPIIAGISYEVLKFSAKHMDSWWVKGFTLPGRLFQRLTTKEPDDSQVEVALAALNRTLELEEKHL